MKSFVGSRPSENLPTFTPAKEDRLGIRLGTEQQTKVSAYSRVQ